MNYLDLFQQAIVHFLLNDQYYEASQKVNKFCAIAIPLEVAGHSLRMLHFCYKCFLKVAWFVFYLCFSFSVCEDK